MGMSDIRVRRSRLLRATPRRHPDAGTSFGSQTAHGRQTVREPDVRMSRRYGTAAPRGSSSRRFTYAELDARADRVAHVADRAQGWPTATASPCCCRTATSSSRSSTARPAPGSSSSRSTGGWSPTSWRSCCATPARRCSSAAAEFDAVVAELHDRTGDDATPVRDWLRVGADGPPWALDHDALVDGGERRPGRRRRRRRRPAVHHVHLGHHRAAEGRVAHPRQRRVGRAHGAGHRRRALPGPLPDLPAAVPRRRAQPAHRHHLPRRHGRSSCASSTRQRIWTIFRDEQVTVTLAVPAMLNFMLQTYDPSVHQPLQLRWIMSGAAPVPPSLIEEYAGLGLEIHQVYGLTETCGPACLISPDEALDAHRVDRQGRSSTPTSASSTTTATTSAPTSPARCSSAAGTSWPATGTAPRRPPRRSGTAGCTPATSPSATPTASSSSATGSRT